MTDADILQVKALLRSLGLIDGNGNVNVPRLSGTTATSATAGANGAVPAQVSGYLLLTINGTQQKVPYYAP